MDTVKRSCLSLFVMILFSAGLCAQDPLPSDSSIVFKPTTPDLVSSSLAYKPLRNAWGVDLMVSNNGFGLGGFWRHEYSDELSGFINLAVSDVKDEGEVEYVNQYTGQTFVPGKKNRLMMVPMTVGVQYRLFKDDIVDNFRPYISAGMGPTMVFVAPYSNTHVTTFSDGSSQTQTDQVEFFSSIKYGHARYTIGGYIGGGAYFGLDRGTLSGVSFRYYFIPFKNGIEILDNVFVKQFGGFYITINFGSMY